MPYEIRVEEEAGVVEIRAYGEGSREEGMRAFAEGLRLARDVEVHAVLLDILELEFIPSNADASVFSGGLAELGSAGLRIAIVAPPGAAYGVARMVAILTELVGARVTVFESREDAMRWFALPG